MKKKSFLILITASTLVAFGTTTLAIVNGLNSGVLTNADSENNYWYHYERVAPTLTKHGSKEFWANCSTHNYVLANPGGGEDIREGGDFSKTAYFEALTSEDPRYLPSISEKVDIKGYLQTLVAELGRDPYSYIPESMRPVGVSKVTESSVTYDFSEFTNVSNIKYGGFGEQWHMVVENIKESQRFYNVVNYGSEILIAARTVAYAFLDAYEENTVTHTFSDDSRYISQISFNGTLLKYNIKYLSSISIPLFGDLMPQLDLSYNVTNEIKTIRFQIGEGNALKFISRENSYEFALEYGVEQVSRKAYFSLEKDDKDDVTGHIYEFVQYKGKDLIGSCADFYIGSTYTSVVGNKASGITGFAGYINELYETENGKLLGYKVRETFSKWGIEKTYNTLWFNLNNIANISSVKAIDNGGVDPHENNHDIYLNGSETLFEPVRNKYLLVNTSRRYDVEMRKQYFYDTDLNEFETKIPMMFIQDDGDKSGETNYSTFESDILSKNGIAASVTLASKYLTKIREDYASLIDVFISHKELVTGEVIQAFIGNAEVIG